MRGMQTVGGLGTILAAAAVVAAGTLGSPAGAAALPEFGTDPVQDTSSLTGSPIVDVRVGANEGFDRFVVEFEGSVGPYFVSYVDQIAQDGSGDPVPVVGEAFIQITLNAIPNEPPAAQATIDAGLTGLIQVVGAGAGFEATVSYGLGTAQAAGFRTFTLTEPTRLVVDVAHPDVTPTATNTADPTASESSAGTTSAATSTQPTPVEAAGQSGLSDNWLIFLIALLVFLAIIAGIFGWRMRRPGGVRR